MDLSAKKIAILALMAAAAITVWQLGIPYAKKLMEASLEKSIRLELLSSDPQPIEAAFGSTTITVELVATEEDLKKGLSDRFFLDDGTGMLFVYDEPGYYGIWMKDMLFPIDIAWLDRGFQVVHIESDIEPSTFPEVFKPDLPALYVLEVNAGFFKANGISPGDTLNLVEESFSL